MDQEVLFGKVLDAYRAYYNVKTEDVEAPFDAEAVFAGKQEQYFLMHSAKLAEVQSNEYVYLAKRPVLREEEVFCRVRVTPLGNGIEWDEKTVIPAETLYAMGEALPLKPEDFEQFTKYRTLDTTMLAARMHCSRQYIKQLTDKGSLHPLRAGSNHVLYPAREAEAGNRRLSP